MTEYVLILPIISGNKSVLLVTKDKPEHPKGLNLCGGKVEAGESPQQAALRELREESGLLAKEAILCGKIVGSDWTVYCLYAEINRWNCDLSPRPEETEQIAFYEWDTVKTDPRLIPNLKIIIPMLRMRTVGWTILDVDKRKEFSVKLD